MAWKIKIGLLSIAWDEQINVPIAESEPESEDFRLMSDIDTRDEEGREVKIKWFSEGGVTFRVKGRVSDSYHDYGYLFMFNTFPAIIPEIEAARQHFRELQRTREELAKELSHQKGQV